MKNENQEGLGNPLVVATVASVAKTVLPYALGAGVLYFTYKKLFPDDKHEATQRDKYWFTDEFGVKYNALDIAANYRAAMGGEYDGTSEVPLMDLAKISRGSRFSNISKAYYKITSLSLLNKLASELGPTNLATFNAIRNNVSSQTNSSNTIHYEFGIGETVALKSNFTAYKVVKSVNGKWKFSTESFYLNWGGLGKITNRKRFRKSGTSSSYDNYYETQDYPDIYILGTALERDI